MRAQREEAEMRMVAFLATQLAACLKAQKPPRWPGTGRLAPKYDLPPEQSKWKAEMTTYLERSLKDAGFPGLCSEVAESFVETLPPKKRARVELAREATARFWSRWKSPVGPRDRPKRITARTVREYELAVALLDGFAERLVQPDVLALLNREFEADIKRLGGDSPGVLGRRLRQFVDGGSDSVRLTVSDPRDPDWLPSVLFGFNPQQELTNPKPC